MKRFEIVAEPVRIEKLVPGGQGIGTLDSGIKGFFWNALPGELVTKFQIAKKKSKYFEAIALEISDPSPHRITPKDECYLSTSPWQIMNYAYELEQKSELLTEQFLQADIKPFFLEAQSSASVVTEAPAAIPRPVACGPSSKEGLISIVQTDGQDFYYRNKMEYALYWDQETEKIELAFHQRGSHRKIPIKSSNLERPEILEKAKNIVNELNAKHEEARKYQSLILRCNQNGQVEGGLLENGKPHPVFNNLKDTILDNTYSYSPNGFFQINLPAYELALKEIKNHIKTENVLDLYSGVGTIGLSVARGKVLTLVEVNASAYRELEKNCENINTAKPVLAKSEDALEYIAPDQTVILDPPRAGCDKKLIDKLLEIKPKSIIYLSCNPATQTRDVKLLLSKYEIQKISPFNFFPRTPHLENLIILEAK